MSAIVTELLGTDAFADSRLTINANFDSLLGEINLLESSLGISTSGNINVTAYPIGGGQILGLLGGFNTLILPATGTTKITLTGSTGAIVAGLVTCTSLVVPTANISTTLTVTGASTLGATTFNGLVTFTNLAGIARPVLDLGSALEAHTVINSDGIMLFIGDVTSPAMLTLTPDASLVDGHIITLVDKVGGSTLNTSNILGFDITGSIGFNARAYASSITLVYKKAPLLINSKWIVIGSSNMLLT